MNRIEEQGLQNQVVAKYLECGNYSETARAFAEYKITPQMVSFFLKNAARGQLPIMAAREQTEKAITGSIFDLKHVLQSNYEDLQEILTRSKDAERDKMSLLTLKEIRETAGVAMKTLEMMASVEEIQNFQNTVLEVIESVDPALRAKIVSELKRRRSTRLAFGLSDPGGGSWPSTRSSGLGGSEFLSNRGEQADSSEEPSEEDPEGDNETEF